MDGSQWEPIAEDATIEAAEALKLVERWGRKPFLEGVTIVNGEVTALALLAWGIAGKLWSLNFTAATS